MTQRSITLTERQAQKVQARAVFLQGLCWPSAPWTDTDHLRFKEASDRWDAEHDADCVDERESWEVMEGED